ncbi:hypothetical protein VIGAN_08057500 [Vigna angularis var. angularis]|uniref:Uncharacterized protein n=1 Tax=Vigna angularis var. angularis TaxID=157739 RepID=A0A0S3SMF0_PHAAN|nr:hypothetical protein VIGAN_08057500 [Vigna angularis var. angularis]
MPTIISYLNNHSLELPSPLEPTYFGSGNICDPKSEPTQKDLNSFLFKTCKEAVDEAAESPIGLKKYATREARMSGFQTLYCQAECTPDLSPMTAENV